MPRSRLANRRPSVTQELSGGSVTLGFDPVSGRILEVFGNDRRSGNHLLSDACMVVSIALQSGVAPQQLQHSLGTMPVWTGPKGR
jgi:hypothetical protein